MKALILSTYDQGGGAAIAAYQQLEALRRAGVSARMLIAAPFSENKSDNIRSVGGNRWQILRYVEKLGTFMALGGQRSLLFRFSDASTGLDISRDPWVEWADVIHIHWVQQSFLSITGLEKLLRLPHKQFFWTLHDLWPLTGGCHSPYILQEEGTKLCSRYQVGCGCCPLLGSNNERDRTATQFEQKRSLPMDRVHYLGVSRAVTEAALRSPLTNVASYLPDHYDPTLFHPAIQKTPTGSDSFRLLFVAARLDDPVKGLDLLRDVLEEASSRSAAFRERAELLCVGRVKDPTSLDGWPIAVIHHDPVSQVELVDHYQSADLTLSTSRLETFGLTLLESLACGTPVGAFEVGGISDIVQDGVNGFLVAPYDRSEMATRLLRCFEGDHAYSTDELVQSVANFTESAVMQQLLSLYQGALSQGQRSSTPR